MKKILIVGLFVGVFALAVCAVFALRDQKVQQVKQNLSFHEDRPVSDSVHSYSVTSVQSGCSVEDEIFCAVERAVKCTLMPELDGCSKKTVPGFILARPDVTERPTEMTFTITKIKPIAGSGEVFVYTQSTCDTVWFGLCEGTVVYSVTSVDGTWAVTNVYALEE